MYELIFIVFVVYILYRNFISKTGNLDRKSKTASAIHAMKSGTFTTNTTSIHTNDDDDKLTYEEMQEAQKIADNVKTHRGLMSLENRIQDAEFKAYDHEDGSSGYENYMKKAKILQEAYNIASTKPYRYIFDDYISADTPLAVLKLAGKSISKKTYDDLPDDLKDYFTSITIEDAGNVQEADSFVNQDIEEINDFKAYRSIIESEITESEKADRLNSLFSKSQILRNEFDIEEDSDISPYDQYKDNYD